MIRILAAPALVALLATAGNAQTLMVVESSNDAVMLFDGFDGSLLDSSFIDLTVAGGATPIEALVVGNEIWISDQLLDGFMRFSIDGTTWNGNITGSPDNCRGFEVVGSRVFLSNSSGTPGDAVIEYDDTGTEVTFWPAGDPFDVLSFGNDLLIANIAADALDVHALDGTFLFTFHDSDGVTGIDFPEQANHGLGGNILAAGFSAPSGIYEYDSTGVQLNYYDTGAIDGQTGLRGVWPLGNGNILYTNNNGVHVLDPVNLTSTNVVGGVSGRFISLLEEGGDATPAFCFGDGTGTACPCGNTGNTGQGCANGTGQGGVLADSGTTSIGNDDLVLMGSNLVAGQPGLYFQGDNAVNGGLGDQFGDGLRCAGTNVVRLQVVNADAGGTSMTTDAIAAEGGVTAGDTRHYQLWYRDPTGTPCGSTFNLTNGVTVTWQP